MNQGLITFIDQSDPLLMLSKHICGSTFAIDTFYEEGPYIRVNTEVLSLNLFISPLLMACFIIFDLRYCKIDVEIRYLLSSCVCMCHISLCAT